MTEADHMHGIEKTDISFISIGVTNLLSDIYATGWNHRQATTLLIYCQVTWGTKSPEDSAK